MITSRIKLKSATKSTLTFLFGNCKLSSLSNNKLIMFQIHFFSSKYLYFSLLNQNQSIDSVADPDRYDCRDHHMWDIYSPGCGALWPWQPPLQDTHRLQDWCVGEGRLVLLSLPRLVVFPVTLDLKFIPLSDFIII